MNMMGLKPSMKNIEAGERKIMDTLTLIYLIGFTLTAIGLFLWVVFVEGCLTIGDLSLGIIVTSIWPISIFMLMIHLFVTLLKEDEVIWQRKDK